MKACSRLIAYLLFALLSPTGATGQSLHDVFTHETLEIENHVKELPPDEVFIRKKVNIIHFHIRNAVTKGQLAINAQTPPLCMGYVEEEGAFLKVLHDLADVIAVYNSIKMSGNRLESEVPIPATTIPVLEDISCVAQSYIAQRIFFKVVFTFRIPVRGGSYNHYGIQDNKIALRVEHHYIADCKTGKIERLHRDIPAGKLEIILSKVSKRINDEYAFMTSKLTMRDLELIETEEREENEYEEENEDEENDHEEKDPDSATLECEDICPRIRMRDAVFYWYGWGIIMEFPDFTETSRMFRGCGFSIFLPYEEAAKLLGGQPAFSFLKTLKPAKTSLSDFNYFQIGAVISKALTIPDASEVVWINAPEPLPVRLSTKSYQIYNDTSRNYRLNIITTFLANGRPEKKMFFEPTGELHRTETYTYSSSGALVGTVVGDENGVTEESNDRFKFDASGNLIERVTVNNSQLSASRFFYNGVYIYMLNDRLFGAEKYDPVRQIKLSDELCIDNECYVLNGQGVIIGTRSKYYPSNQTQIGYDNKGRVVEAHRDRDRYHYYFTYDELDRLARYQQFEYQSPVVDVKYTYEGKSRLPTRQDKVSRNGQTVELETYEWTLRED